MTAAPAVNGVARGRPLHEIETWIFDLDNTLYPATANVFPQVEERMNAFIAAELRIELQAAHELRRRYFLAHGTTLRGLMMVDRVDPRRFLDYVHAIDLAGVPADEELGRALEALPGRKLVFTNGSLGHAERLLDHLGIARHFSGIFDIIAADYVPKPDPAGYRELVRRYGVDPRAALMVEDIARNLAPAAALGMTTAWVSGTVDWAVEGADADHIHHVVEALAPWLHAAARPPAGNS